ncbi:protein-disulfide reductase DsbD family protein [Aquimarina agarivorans]|uniref:protein-disulfide reductase DsbD family protein n=1 Tax=Aquimarina agarivorans TaxID=980584 RepID=UPI000248EB23|nr:cytochrome c biogenesis protein CcdA [Aquimarina agarivorans]
MKIYNKDLLKFLFLFLISTTATAQVFNPVTWKTSTKDLGGNEYEIQFKASIKEGWHVYSQHIKGDEGPLPTEFSVKAENITLLGGVSEPKGIEGFDKTFEMDIKYFETAAVFIQKLKLLDGYTDPIKASVLFMVCDDERCLPPEEKEFTINLKSSKASVATSSSISDKDQKLSESLRLPIKSSNEFRLSSVEKKGLWKLFFLGFLGGLIALLTPCVFPMIPLTVSFFSHSSGSSSEGIMKALLYGLFILTIYILVSVPFHVMDSVNPDVLNNVSTNTWLNVLFFVIFVVFAISFFGYFEITLPAKWSNAMDSKATKLGGVFGVFFMALTLTLVSFSCTGPILGSLLGGSLSNDGGAIQLTYGMAGFGLALALPFAFFALFPNLLKRLPKSGGWMTTVKVVLGFIELAFALKFLSNADLVQHWGILKREIFIGLWILVALGLAAYLFGLFRFPHDAPNQKINLNRKILGTIALVFTGYLVPGVLPTDAPNLKLLSGFPPPTFYSIYNKHETNTHSFGKHVFTDFDAGFAAAEKMNKPILIDFTGWACVNCRKMEEQVWSVPKVKKLLDDQVVLISLYVDDRKKLNKENRFTYQFPNSSKLKKIKTIGDKWATFQTINFKNNSQPYYVLMDTSYNLLQNPVGYTPDVDTYYNWLKEGVAKSVKN